MDQVSLSQTTTSCRPSKSRTQRPSSDTPEDMFGLAYRAVAVCCNYLYPIYGSFKSIKASDPVLMERWLMYWAVIAAITLVEVSLEWLVNWMPFYYEIKTLALLWLTLPQIDGASYVYINHLHPWLLAHETEIDLFLLSAKSRAKQAGLDYARRIWLAAREMIVREVLGQTPQGEVAGPSGQSAQSSPNQQSWFPFASSFVQQYGPSALAAGHALFHPMDQSRQVAPPGSAKATSFGTTSTSQQRRQQLEDELRSLTPPRKDTFGQSVSRPGSPRGSSGSLGALGESYETIEKEEIIALKRGSPSSSPSFTVKSTASPSPTLSHRSSWFWSGQKKGEQAKHPKSE